MTWHLASAEARHAASPETFEIPTREDRDTVVPGQLVKLIFEAGDFAERMWVRVVRRDDVGYMGELRNNPLHPMGLTFGTAIRFGPEHITVIHPVEDF